jgi:thioredoxin 1
MPAAVEITKENFQTEVLDSQVPVLLDLWAEWCGPCRMVGPVVEELAEEYAGRLKVGKIDVDDQPELAGAFQVQSIPMLLLVKQGAVVAAAIGARPKQALAQALELDEHVEAAA